MQLGFISGMKNELKNAVHVALKSKSASEISTVRISTTIWQDVLSVDVLLKDNTVLNGILKKKEGTELYELISPLAKVENKETK